MKRSNLKITELNPDNMEAIQKVAELLFKGFREHNPDGWPDIESALQEVGESFQEGRISRIAVNDDNTVMGWIGGIRKYHGKTWELHPLVVDPDFQGEGIGRALVKDLEEQVKERGEARCTSPWSPVTTGVGRLLAWIESWRLESP